MKKALFSLCLFMIITSEIYSEETCQLAEKMFQSSLYHEAINLYLSVIEEDKTRDEEILLKLSQSFYHLKQYPEAILHLNRLLSLNKKQKDAIKLLGISYLRLFEADPKNNPSSLEQAETILSQQYLENPDTEIRLALASCYLQNPKKRFKAKQLLLEPPSFSTIEAKSAALQLLALCADTYDEKAFVLQEMETLNKSSELIYLQGLILSSLYRDEGEKKHYHQAVQVLKQGIKQFPNAQKLQQLLGKIYFQEEKYEQAEDILCDLIKTEPSGENLFWYGRCKLMLGRSKDSYLSIFEKVYTNYPESPYAPEAYFSMYPFKDYLQGERKAARHLQSLPEKFPESLLATTALFLTGLDLLKDRKTAEGKWIRKKNLPVALHYFTDAVDTFNKLSSQGKIPEEELHYYTTIKYRALLEKALIHLAISKESQGAKKQIYLEFAEELLAELTHELNQKDTFHTLLEESSYLYACTLSEREKHDHAKKILLEMLTRFESAKITRGYYLSKAWYQLGLLAQQANDYELALKYFVSAEDASKGKVLTNNERIELCIRQSDCHRQLGRLDLAMLILSQIINESTISSLRVKAEFLRAELYEIQGREELAIKQLEATAKKGGTWAEKAQLKLKKQYGYL